eukprot:SAG31_NODE_487_length_14980_cov_9.526376_16_plen_286_part_00
MDFLNCKSQGGDDTTWSACREQFPRGDGVCHQCGRNKENLMFDTSGQSAPHQCENGDTRFMFARGDQDQNIVINLGRPRSVNKIGAEIDTGDRDVWDFFRAEVSDDGITWTEFGTVGEDDASPDALEHTEFIEASDPVTTQYIRYSFGPNSHNHGGVGSAVHRLFASGHYDESDEPPQSCWIGLNDQEREGRLSWTDGTPVDYFNWAPGEPNDWISLDPNDYKPDGEDCADLDIRRTDASGNPGWWNDIPCQGEASQGGTGDTAGMLFPICRVATYRPPTTYTCV